MLVNKASRTIMNKKQTLQLPEALHHFGQEAGERSFTVLTAEPSPYPSSLRLTEPLQICLLAVASRYPGHCLEINEVVLGPQDVGTQGWRARELIGWLQNTAPALLQEEARLEVTLPRRGIYLLNRSEEMPAFWVRGTQEGEKRPIYRDHLAVIRAERAWGGAE